MSRGGPFRSINPNPPPKMSIEEIILYLIIDVIFLVMFIGLLSWINDYLNDIGVLI